MRSEMTRSSLALALAAVLAMSAPAAFAGGRDVGPGVRDVPGETGFRHFRRPQSLFAVVDAAGGLVSGSGVAGVTYLGTGRYEVTFTRGVGHCAYLATTENAHSQALQAYTAGGHLSGRGVYVETKNQGGGLTDGPFHLVVACSGPGVSYAVVGYSADLVRGTFGTTLTPLGSGRYEVRFPRRFHPFGRDESCAYLATVGDPAADLVFNPSGVYTGSGPDERTVYVETKNPGGGLQDGVPFHLAAICTSALSAKTRVAVVAKDGLLDRGSPWLASFRSGEGRYALVANQDLAGCATVATRGSVNRDVPFSPATVEVVPGPAPNTVGLDVRNLLFFGDTPLDEAFHAVTVCR
jgi:hypothetical protein